MPAEFIEIQEHEDPQVYVRKLMPAYHGHLVEARIAYLWREGKWASKGVTTLGKAYKLSGHNEYLADQDFVIVLNHDVWKGLSPDQRLALVDHELSHCEKAEDAQGNTIWQIAPHDLEEFTQIVRRHGLWHPEGPRFGQAMREYEQLPLPLDPGITAVSFGTPEDFKAGRQVTFTGQEAAEMGANLKEAMTKAATDQADDADATDEPPDCFGDVENPPDEMCANDHEEGGETVPTCPHYTSCKATGEARAAAIPATEAAPTIPDRPPVAYREADGSIITVRQGLGDDWGSFRQAASGSWHRVKSPKFPMRATREEAEIDLIAWAEAKGLEWVDTETGEIVGGEKAVGQSAAPNTRIPLNGRPTVMLTIDGEDIEYVEVWRSAVAGTPVAMLEATTRRPPHDHDAIAVEITDNAAEPYVRITHKELANRVCDAYQAAFEAKQKTA